MEKLKALDKIHEQYKMINTKKIKNIGCTVGLIEEDNYFKWRATLFGPRDTSYNGGLFYIELDFPENFPKKPPIIYFLTPIYHLNINYKKPAPGQEPLGYVSASFTNYWDPSTTIREILIKLSTVFYLTNPGSPYGLERANEFMCNPALYEEKVKYFTKKYASPMELSKYKLWAEKDWDFSYPENGDLKQINSKTESTYNYSINYHENENEDKNKLGFNDESYDKSNINDDLIKIRFDESNGISTFIECKTDELTLVVINRFKCERGFERDSNDFLFIFNSKKLKLGLSIEENRLKNGDDILCICISGIFFAI